MEIYNNNPSTKTLILILVILVPVAILNWNEHKILERIQKCESMHAQIMLQSFQPASTIKAKAAYVYNFADNKELYSKNSDQPLPLASITKLMTIRIALQHEPQDKEILIKNIGLDGNNFDLLGKGKHYSLKSVATAALIESSNDAATAVKESTGLSDESFFAEMNSEALRLGLKSFLFKSATGLDINDKIATSFGDAHDVTFLTYNDFFDFPNLFIQSRNKTKNISSVEGKTITVKNTDLAIDSLPLLVASKTGYTDVAGGNLTILWTEKDSGQIIGATVIGSTKDERFTDMITLYNSTNSYLESEKSLETVCGK